ncbi:PDZ domain-containing protein, partial [Streptomyces sp. NPDC059515]|uniref:PDZ domain-containing protein n=1 Tax=Streptomyces sp. NPDC059515 TaxID=3346854 RepID=UPI0036B5BF8E
PRPAGRGQPHYAPAPGCPPPPPPPRPPPPRGGARRLVSALFTAFVGTVLVLAGIGLGATGATVIGADGLTELKRHAGLPVTGPSATPRPAPAASVPAPSATPVVGRLGLEVADDRKPGALVVGVHVPGPGYAAGLVRGDVLLAFGTTRIDTAADLARAVARARPGREVVLTVRHRSGAYQQLTAVPGIVT